MNRVITIGREFGSGGRELGRRLAEALGMAYYDREIMTEIAKRTSLSERYINQVVERRPVPLLPITVGHTFSPVLDAAFEQNQAIYQEQRRLIQDLADRSDCVIVGRCADYILRDYEGVTRLFIHASMESRMERCRRKGPEHEHLNDKELRQHIQRIDRNRAKYYEFYTGQSWGDKANYDLCINTTKVHIKDLAAKLAPCL